MFWILFPLTWYRRWVPLISKAPGVSEEVIEELAKAVREAGLKAEVYVAEDRAVVGREVFIVADGLTPSKRVDALKHVYRAVPPVLVPAIHVMDREGFDVIKRGLGGRLRRVWPK